jgi:hypothetical protein
METFGQALRVIVLIPPIGGGYPPALISRELDSGVKRGYIKEIRIKLSAKTFHNPNETNQSGWFVSLEA